MTEIQHKRRSSMRTRGFGVSTAEIYSNTRFEQWFDAIRNTFAMCTTYLTFDLTRLGWLE